MKMDRLCVVTESVQSDASEKQQAAEECSFGAVGDDTPGREVCAGSEEEIERREGRRGTHPLTPANPRYCLGCQ